MNQLHPPFVPKFGPDYLIMWGVYRSSLKPTELTSDSLGPAPDNPKHVWYLEVIVWMTTLASEGDKSTWDGYSSLLLLKSLLICGKSCRYNLLRLITTLNLGGALLLNLNKNPVVCDAPLFSNFVVCGCWRLEGITSVKCVTNPWFSRRIGFHNSRSLSPALVLSVLLLLKTVWTTQLARGLTTVVKLWCLTHDDLGFKGLEVC